MVSRTLVRGLPSRGIRGSIAEEVRMDQVRKGEIALAVLKNQLRKKGLTIGPNFIRELGNAAKSVGVPKEEIIELAEELTRELVDEIFAKKGQAAV